MSAPVQGLTARLLAGAGCLMVVGVPLVVIASCTFHGSSGGQGHPVRHTVAPTAVVYVPAPHGAAQGPSRRSAAPPAHWGPAPTVARRVPPKALTPAKPAARPPGQPPVRAPARPLGR